MRVFNKKDRNTSPVKLLDAPFLHFFGLVVRKPNGMRMHLTHESGHEAVERMVFFIG
jgi:hypothetical protein